MKLKHHLIPLMFRSLLQKALSVILIVCCKAPGELQEQSFFAGLCLSLYQVLILKLFLFCLLTDCFSYCLCGKYRTEPIANEISLVHAETKIILVHLLSQSTGQMQVINNMELSVAGDPFKDKLFWLERRTT